MPDELRPRLSYEPTEADGSPRVVAGMSRTPWPEFSRSLAGGYVLCSCGETLQIIPRVRQHWEMGHFDAPVYEVRG